MMSGLQREQASKTPSQKNRNDSEETTAFLAKKAAEKALEKANLTAKDLDFIVLQL